MSERTAYARKWRLVFVIVLPIAIGTTVVLTFFSRAKPDDLTQLLERADQLDRRPFVGRLADLRYRPREETTRSTGRRETLPRLRLRAAAIELAEASTARKETSTRYIQGVAQLFAGQTDEAIHVLTEATRRPDAPARAWNDLAVATLQRALAEDDPKDAAHALAAANRALEMNPRMPEALYNRVLALERLGLELNARDAAKQYFEVDGTTEWSLEIRDRVRQFETPTRAEEWQNTVAGLERPSSQRNPKVVAAAVSKFPQQARAWGEGEFLGRWSDAVIEERTADAQHWLSISREIGRALVEANGERYLLAVVEHLDGYHTPKTIALIFRTYRNGRIALDRRRVTEAVPLLRDAQRGFERTASPLQFLAGYYLAVALLDANELAESQAVLERVETASNIDYRALRAQCNWHHANLLSRAGRLYEAHTAAQRALEQFERLREENHRTRMQSSVATALARLGRTDEAWKLRCAALRSAARSGDTRTLETTLNSTVRHAIREGEWAIAQAFLDAYIARGIASPRLRADALLWRAFTQAHLRGEPVDVRTALDATAEIGDDALRQQAIIDVRFAEAVILRPRNPERAVELFNDVIAWRERNGGLDLAVAYVERARAQRAMRQVDLASIDLARAITIVEAQRADIARDDVRDTFFGSAEDAYEELVELRLDQRNAAEAFVAAERMRARVVLDRLSGRTAGAAEIPDPVAVQSALPSGVQLVHYSLLPHRMLVVTFDNRGWYVSTISVERAAIERLREELVSAIAQRDRMKADATGRRLYDILMRPLPARSGEMLVVVPDETLAELPFSALVNRDGRFLIEETAVMAAPSAAAFVREARRARNLDLAAGEAVLVADPAFDQGLFPRLQRLTSAAREVRFLTETLPKTVALIGSEATPSRMFREAQGATILHIAAHAMTNRTNPSLSFFVLAPDGNHSGVFYLRDVAENEFAPNLVVLSGCRTAAASQSPGSIRSLTMAFIAAGSRNVLGSLWDIEDKAATELARSFYRNLLTESHPARALRLAQLEMLRSPESEMRDVRAWGALQIYGT